MLQDGHAHDAAHDRLMGHRPKDTKTLNYSVKQLPFLAAEMDKIAFDLPADAPSFGAKRLGEHEDRGVPEPEDVG